MTATKRKLTAGDWIQLGILATAIYAVITSNRASQRADDAQQASNKALQEAGDAQQAVVLVTQIQPLTKPEPGKPMRLLIVAQNSGHTPAVNVRAVNDIRITDYGTDTRVPDNTPDGPPISIGAGQSAGYQLDTQTFTPDDAKGVLTKERRLYLAIRLRYDDSRGNSHVNETCTLYDVDRNFFIAGCVTPAK